MAFTIPNDNQSGIDDTQATWMQTDVDALAQGFNNSGVLVGCLVAPQTSPNMTVQVASGSVQVAGLIVAVTGTNLSITAADAAVPRVDLVVCNNAGALSVITGMAAAQPTLPALPANSVPLAAVFVPPLASSIAAIQLVDKRVILATPTGIDVTHYGAVADGLTDSTAAIQAAVTASISAPTRIPIHFPAGSAYYKITAPILIHGVALPTLTGDSGASDSLGTTIQTNGVVCPCFHLRGVNPGSDLTFTTSLATGPGQALVTSRATMATDTFIDFCDAATSAQLNGLSQFGINLFIKIASYTTDFQDHVLESFGSLTNQSTTSAYTLKLDTSGHLIGGINVGGTLTPITSSGALSLATTYYIELSYDGAHVHLFYGTPGNTTTLAGTVTTTGTVRQGLFEQMSVGGQRLDWPHGPKLSDCMSGSMDSILFSNVALHSSTFTAPTTKHTATASTLLLENFDNETSDFSIITTGVGSAYLPKYSQNGEQGSFADISQFEFRSAQSGIHATGMIQSHIHHCSFRGGVYGFNAGKDTFTNTYGPRLYFTWGSDPLCRGALIQVSQTGIDTYDDMRFTGYPTQLVIRTGSATIRSLYFTGGDSVIPLILREGNYSLDSVSFSNEDNPSATYQACIYTDHATAITCTNTNFEFNAANVPAVIVGTLTQSLSLIGCPLIPKSGATTVISVLSAPARPILVQNCPNAQPTVAMGIACTFANAPTAPLEGDRQVFTDSNTTTWGANIAGSSTNRVLGRYNGTNWTVEAK